MILLASQSPRRIELMQQAGIQFKIQHIVEIEEVYPSGLKREEIPLFIARLKAKNLFHSINIPDDTVVITADTIVWLNDRVLCKPGNREEAVEMLQTLSAKMHYVFTGVCLTTNHKQHSFFDETKVFFKKLTDDEITFYVDRYKPYDKAGAYGIQEWIGYIGIEKIEGSFYNVMGLPIHKLYSELHIF